jgi:hypothetical protein
MLATALKPGVYQDEVIVTVFLAAMLVAFPCFPLTASDPDYVKELLAWRDAHEQNLRADNGWLTLAGRFPLKAGANTIGTAKDNDVVFPPELKGTGPSRLGVIHVDDVAMRVILRPAEGVEFVAGGKPIAGERAFATDKPDWVGLGRLQFHIIIRDGKYFLRLADNESAVRKSFPGCVWYPADERFKVEATFVATRISLPPARRRRTAQGRFQGVGAAFGFASTSEIPSQVTSLPGRFLGNAPVSLENGSSDGDLIGKIPFRLSAAGRGY